MTAPTPRTTSSLERELSEMYREDRPPAHVTALIDGRVATALERDRARPARAPRRRTLVLAASVSLVAAVAFAGGAVAQRVLGDGIVFVDGILFRDGVIERPGLTNFGQPFWGTDIFERSPAEAAEMAAEKGYVIRWQIEVRGGTQSGDDDEISFSEEAPPCGKIGGGSVIEEGRIQMVVVLDDPSTPGSEC
jgi:hypothetical protein